AANVKLGIPPPASLKVGVAAAERTATLDTSAAAQRQSSSVFMAAILSGLGSPHHRVRAHERARHLEGHEMATGVTPDLGVYARADLRVYGQVMMEVVGGRLRPASARAGTKAQ